MTPPPNDRHVAIIGCGFSGLCVAMQLVRAGIRSFTIFEKGDRLGGTWRDNVYPGAACDIPSLEYCFSFERRVEWSRKWAPQPEILAYMEACAQKYGLARHVRYGTEIAGARFDEAAKVWRLETTKGESFSAEVLVSAVGQLHRPATPTVEGIETFGGRSFHSARWPAGDDLAGQRVAVVGNAASGVQLIPQIVKSARQVSVFQRSPNWILPKEDRVYTGIEHFVMRKSPALARAMRWSIWAQNESRMPVLTGNRLFSAVATWMGERHLERQVPDPELRRKLTPDYPIGAKRILLSDDYFPALQQPHVRLVTTPIVRAVREGLVTRSGAREDTIPADTIVFATGFRTTEFLAPMRIEGTGGRTLEEAWRYGAEAYLGITVSGFPNLFLMYGPNTSLGHNSVLFMMECQARYLLDALRQMRERGVDALDVRPEAQAAFSAEMQQALGATVWAEIESSWYKNERGRITNNWPYTTAAYFFRTRRVDLSHYSLVLRPLQATPVSARATSRGGSASEST
jgi:cation diffusion facilitator CzcD-associated flavoprotein CzcO